MGSAMTIIELREMQVSDVEAVAEVDAKASDRPWTVQVLREEIGAPGRTYLVAEEEEEVVGFGGVMVVGEEAHINNLVVRPDRQRQRIGTRLMARLARVAIEAGATGLTLEVRPDNHAARALYANFGMAPVGIRRAYYGKVDALVLWVHDIDEPDYAAGLDRLSEEGCGR